MLCFSRDSDILLGLHRKPGYMQVVLKGKQPSPENTVIFPPSGVIPFHGFTMYGKELRKLLYVLHYLKLRFIWSLHLRLLLVYNFFSKYVFTYILIMLK